MKRLRFKEYKKMQMSNGKVKFNVILDNYGREIIKDKYTGLCGSANH